MRQRREFMRADDVSETVQEMRAEVIAAWSPAASRKRPMPSSGRRPSSPRTCKRLLNLDLPIVDWGREEGIDETGIRERIEAAADQHMAAKAANFGPELMRFVEKSLLLQVLDAVWKEHLLALDHLRQGIGLRAYGQRDPLNEYKSEAFALFNAMLDELKERVTAMLARVELGPEPPPEPLFQPRRRRPVSLHYSDPAAQRPLCRRRRARGRAPGRCRRSTPPTPPPGRTRRATRPARAGPARSTSTATARSEPANGSGNTHRVDLDGGETSRRTPSAARDRRCLRSLRSAAISAALWLTTTT